MRRPKGKLLEAAAATMIVLLPSVMLGISSERSFVVSHAPEVRVLRVELSGGDRMETIRYDLFGDGAMSGFAISAYASFTPQLIFSAQLGLEEYDALVADIVESGLMDFDVRSMDREFREAPLPHTERLVTVTVRLEGYEDASPDPSGAVERRIGIYAARTRAEQFPNVRPLAAVGRLLHHLSDIEKANRMGPR